MYGCPLPVLNILLFFFFMHCTFLSKLCVCGVTSMPIFFFYDYSFVCFWVTFGVKLLSYHAQVIFLNHRRKCLPLSKTLLFLEPSALIVRKLRVLVNNDQNLFFVFSLMKADIKYDWFKTLNCNKILNAYAALSSNLQCGTYWISIYSTLYA